MSLDEQVPKMSLKEKLQSRPKLMIGKNSFIINPDPLDDEYQIRAAKDIRETPETVEKGLETLRQLLEGEPNLKVPTDREHLQKFLRPCKWYPDSAFGLMKRFYKYRLTHPRFCADLVPSNERAIIVSGTLTPLPLCTSDGSRVILLEGGRKWKPKEVSLDQLFRGLILFLEAAIVEPRTQVAGVRVIVDMDGLAISQVTYFTPSFAAAVVEFVQKCLPCRLKGVHIVNQPFIFNMVFACFKPFLHEKLRKRVIFHGTDRNSLKKFFDPEMLPTQFGGDLEVPTEPIGEPLVEYLNLFEEEYAESCKYGYQPTV